MILNHRKTIRSVISLLSLTRIYVNNVVSISVDACLVHTDKIAYTATLMHSMYIYSEYGINYYYYY